MVETKKLATSRQMTEMMLDWLRGRGRIIIILHDNPDPDCLASAMALRHLFIMKLNRDSVIAFNGMIGRSENLAMAKSLEIPLSPLGLLNLKDYQVVCMLDTQPLTGNNSLPSDVKVDIVIDHHPLIESSTKCRWFDIREEYGVTATILFEYLRAQGVTIGTKLATALFYAIKSETQDLGREANRPDRDAYLYLFPLTNKKVLYEITHPKLPVEYFFTISCALKNAKIYENVLTVNLMGISFPEIVAEMADFLIRLEDIETVLSMGHYNDEMILSMRTIRHDINAGEILRRMVTEIGTAGGHGMMAGGKIDDVSSEREILQEMEDMMTERLLQELGLTKAKQSKLIRSTRNRRAR